MAQGKSAGSGCFTVIGVIVAIVFIGSFFGGDKSSTSTPTASRAPSAISSSDGTDANSSSPSGCTKNDLQCWGDRLSIVAGLKCREDVEGLAKYEFKWTDSWYEPKFGRFRWANTDHTAITLVGDKAMMSNGFGAFSRVRYECDMGVPGEEVLRVRASQR